jgi:tetratricopeptide (TPR) repeat protein
MSKIPVVAAATAIMATVVLSEPTKAQSSEAWKACLDGRGEPAFLQISSCTLVIQSGKATAEQITLAYGRACDAQIYRGYPASPIEYCDEAIARDPRGAVHWYSRGRAFSMREDYQHAISDFDEALRLAPQNPFAYSDRCFARLLAGDAQAALADCNEALRLKPDYAAALVGRGFVNLRLDNFDPAIADFDAALRLQGNFAQALYGRGLAKLKKGDDQGGSDISAAKDISMWIVKFYSRAGFAE